MNHNSSNSDSNQLQRLIESLNTIRVSAYWLEQEFSEDLSQVSQPHFESSRNLLHYLALRRHDLREIQEELANLGLSSMGRAESHVLGTLHPVLEILHKLDNREYVKSPEPHSIKYYDGRLKLRNNTRDLLGPSPSVSEAENHRSSPIRIMVTMPSIAAEDYDLVYQLVDAGMNCMRINCSHDDALAWSLMTTHLRRACQETGKECRLFMDLSGPKLRTGPIEDGPKLLRWSPHKDLFGKIIAPAQLWLTPESRPEYCATAGTKTLPLPEENLNDLSEGDEIEFTDLCGTSCKILIKERVGESWLGESMEQVYLDPSVKLFWSPKESKKGADQRTEFYADQIPPLSQSISLMAGDRLTVTSDLTPVAVEKPPEDQRENYFPKIGCTLASVFKDVKVGERIYFDDGKFGGIITEASSEELKVHITYPTSPKKLRGEKGINLPDSNLNLPALTQKDIDDLDFVVDHADIVGLSFVNHPEDIEQLQSELSLRGKEDLPLVLKIETVTSFNNLPLLLLRALRSKSVGVMLARGDLAVECGFERLAEVQEEILWICESGHVPVIWATQVLDRLSKKGLPTRAEVTDAAMSERAECVMLNKGTHVVEAVKLLRNITSRMRGHQEKKMSWLRALSISENLGDSATNDPQPK